MTDNEIIKALECCGVESDCENCPYFKNKHHTCGKNFNKDVLDLINRQKANAEGLINAVKYLSEELTSAKAEIERLEETKNRLSYNLQAVLDERADHSEVVKEFAKFLVDKAENGVISIVDLPDYTREWMVKADESGFNLNTA